MSKRHDVLDLFPAGDTAQNATPGNSEGSDQTVGPLELTCAGDKGCHGAANIEGSDAGIAGFHHGSKEGYRYLQNAFDQAAISGLKSPTWEKGGATATNHNIYSANPATGISALCANCHGQFHSLVYTDSNGDGTGNWVRHPTDVVVPSDWSYNAATDAALNANPLAFKDGATVSTANMNGYTNDGTDGCVACISCHRAHGSAYDDILRFSYTGQNAGSTTVTMGCLGCHSKQRG